MPTNPRASGPRTQRKRPGDMTGTQGQKLAAAAAKAKEDEAKDEAEAVATERATKLATTVSFVPKVVDDVEDDEVDEDEEVEVKAKTEFIRVNFPIEQMTFGREVLNAGDWDEKEMRWNKAPVLGNLQTYDFEEGVRYEVSSDMADHLRKLGYVYEF